MTTDEFGNEALIPDHPYLFKLHKRWNQPNTPICDTKSAQNLITWLAASQHLHDIIFTRNILNLYNSTAQFESTKVKERMQFTIDSFPEWFLSTVGIEQTGANSVKQLTFKEHGRKESAVVFMHSGDTAGRSMTFHRSTMDEFAFQRNAKKIYEGLKGRSIYLNTFSTPGYNKACFMHFVWSGGIDGVDCSTIHYRDNPDKDPNTDKGKLWARNKRQGTTYENWQREQECKWISEGGLVYKTFDRGFHVVDPLPLNPDWEFYRSMDFGWGNAFVHLWVARFSVGRGYRWYIFNELYRSEAYLEDLANEIKAYDRIERKHLVGKDNPDWVLRGRYTKQVSDAAGKRERQEFKRLGIHTSACKKGADSVNLKIQFVREALLNQSDGKPGLIVAKNCVKTIFEFENYMYPKEVADGEHENVPVKRFDHAMDAIGDLLLTVGKKPKVEHREAIVYAR